MHAEITASRTGDEVREIGETTWLYTSYPDPALNQDRDRAAHKYLQVPHTSYSENRLPLN